MQEWPQPVGDDEQRFREIIDALPAAVYATDTSGRLTHFNPACVEFSGRTPQLGTDHWCASWRLFYPDGRPMPQDECPMAIALKEGKIIRDAEVIAERPDGTRVWFTPYPTLMLDDDGQVIGSFNMLVDITKRKQSDHALHSSERELTDFFENATVGLHWVGSDGIVLRVNQAELNMLGYQRDEYVGHHIGEFHADQPVIEDILTRLTQGETLREYPARLKCKDGSVREVLIHSSVLFENGKFIRTRCFTHDVTELRRAEGALRDADVHKNEFLATLAHELRNPLASVCNSLQLLALDDSLSPTVVQIREIMDQQSQQMIRLVDDLLDSSRIARGQIELRRSVVDLASIVASAVQASRGYVDNGKHQLAIQLPADPVTLYADAARLIQVLNNLLNNAAKYTPKGGQIWLTARQVEGGLELSVRDTGVGIHVDELSQVFNLYMQVETSKVDALGGLGLGLALARKLVELHDGRIEVLSKGQNKGAEFRVWLPPSCLHQRAWTPGKRQSESGASPPLRILIVDDTYSSAFVLRSLLEKLGHDVETEADAMAAIEAVIRNKPQMVISDIAMPGVDGHELARRLKLMPEMKGVRLIALTGHGQEADIINSREAGFNDHLVKPVSIQALQHLFSDHASPVP